VQSMLLSNLLRLAREPQACQLPTMPQGARKSSTFWTGIYNLESTGFAFVSFVQG
jgi:hypothetical protein